MAVIFRHRTQRRDVNLTTSVSTGSRVRLPPALSQYLVSVGPTHFKREVGVSEVIVKLFAF